MPKPTEMTNWKSFSYLESQWQRKHEEGFFSTPLSSHSPWHQDFTLVPKNLRNWFH
jgi:hypothetical protein